jgi:hypothetical protein
MRFAPDRDALVVGAVAKARADASKEAAECCEAAHCGAEKHYGTAEEGRASMTKNRILSLLSAVQPQGDESHG